MPQEQKQQKQSFIKIIPKREEKEPVWVNIALAIGGLLLVAVLVPFFLSRGKVGKLEERKQELAQQIAGLIEERRSMSKELSEIAERIGDFSTLFREHRVTSALFGFLGSVCHPLVQFTQFDFSGASAQDFRIALSVKTENFWTLGEQLLIFRENEHISEPELSGISLEKDGFVSAKFDLLLDKKLIMPFSL